MIVTQDTTHHSIIIDYDTTRSAEFLQLLIELWNCRIFNLASLPAFLPTVLPYSITNTEHPQGKMASVEQVKQDYEKNAKSYNSVTSTPTGILESQLIKIALGDPKDAVILDIGGGTGVHAREAIDLGASRVDIVDLSPEMLKVGQEIEKSLGREDHIRFYEADVSKPLTHLHLGIYDIVMANWVFDHAGTVEELESMWHNIVRYLKPGGKFLSIRVGDPRSPALQTEKYGATFKDFRETPGGLVYTCTIHTDPPFQFEGKSMEVSSSGSFELHEKYGLTDVQIIPYEHTEAIKSDREFWKLFLENPSFAVVKGTKRVLE